MCLIQEDLLRGRHAAAHHRRRGAVRVVQRDADEVSGALGDVGVDVVRADLHVFGGGVPGSENRVRRVELVGDPLDVQVVAVREDVDLGIVALVGQDGKDVAGHQLVGRVVVARDGRRAVRQGLQAVGGHRIEVDHAEIDDAGGALRHHLARHRGHLFPPDVVARPDAALRAVVEVEGVGSLEHRGPLRDDDRRSEQVQP